MKKIPLLLLIGLLYAGPARAFSVEHDFTVILGPFNASKTRFTYALTPDSYAVNSTVKTDGMFNALYPFKANYATTGKIVNGNLETTGYHYDSQSRFNKRTKELVYDDNGMPLYRISSKNDKTKKVEIEQNADNRNTTDLQTVFAELARQYNNVKFCDSRMQVLTANAVLTSFSGMKEKIGLSPTNIRPMAETPQNAPCILTNSGQKAMICFGN